MFELCVVVVRGLSRTAGSFLAHKTHRGVEGDAVEPRAGVALLLQVRQAPPDLEQNFLIKIILIAAVPGIGTADFQNLRPILAHEFKKASVVMVESRVQIVIFDWLVAGGRKNITKAEIYVSSPGQCREARPTLDP